MTACPLLVYYLDRSIRVDAGGWHDAFRRTYPWYGAVDMNACLLGAVHASPPPPPPPPPCLSIYCFACLLPLMCAAALSHSVPPTTYLLPAIHTRVTTHQVWSALPVHILSHAMHVRSPSSTHVIHLGPY